MKYDCWVYETETIITLRILSISNSALNLERHRASAHLYMYSFLALPTIKTVPSAVASVYVQTCLETILLRLFSIHGIFFTRTVPRSRAVLASLGYSLG